MDRTKTLMKAIKRIGLLSGVALIAVSASAIPGTVASAAAPIASQRQGQQRSQSWQRHSFSWASYVPGHRPTQWERYSHSFNPHEYHWNRYAEHRYYWHHYVAPQGWYYRRWSYGEVLPPVFWGRQYWLTGYWNFGLIDPPYGYVWVRYGDDALLVDVASGQILSVEYGVFYS